MYLTGGLYSVSSLKGTVFHQDHGPFSSSSAGGERNIMGEAVGAVYERNIMVEAVWVFYTCTRAGCCLRLRTLGGATEGGGEGAEESG